MSTSAFSDDLPPDELSAEEAERLSRMAAMSSALADTTSASKLDPNPQERGHDAAALLTAGMSPMEFLHAAMLGIIEASPVQLASAKALMPYAHKTQPTRVQTELTGDAQVLALAKALNLASDEQLDQLEQLNAARIEPQAARH